MNKLNPPPVPKQEQDFLARHPLVIFGSLATGLYMIFFGYRSISHGEDIFGSIGIIVIGIGLLTTVAHHEAKKPKPIPLVSWQQAFEIPTHSIEIAFQMPEGFNTQPLRERLIIAVKVALRNFNEKTLQEDIEKAVEKDVDELEIPVFRIHIVELKKKEPQPPKLTHDIVAADIIEPVNPLMGDIEIDE